MRASLNAEQYALMLSLECDDRMMEPAESAIAIDLWMAGLCHFDVCEDDPELVGVVPTDAGRLSMTCYRLAQEASPR